MSVVIPCFNEEKSVNDTVLGVIDAMSAVSNAPWEIILVDDGSTDDTPQIMESAKNGDSRVRVFHHHQTRGYGASLKTGILQTAFDKIVFVDADGTYPLDQIPILAATLATADMVVGARIKNNAEIPFVRRPIKWLLLRYARFLSQEDIKDLNSGLRAVWAVNLFPFWKILPDGFSFTSTITLAMHINGFRVHYVPIDYYRRLGISSIRPLRDTLLFFGLISRTAMLFRPLAVFGSMSFVFCMAAVIVGFVSKFVFGQLADVTTLSFFSTGLILFGLGLIGDLINARAP